MHSERKQWDKWRSGQRGRGRAQRKANRSFPPEAEEAVGSHEENASTVAGGHEADEVCGLRAGFAMYLRIKAVFSAS